MGQPPALTIHIYMYLPHNITLFSGQTSLWVPFGSVLDYQLSPSMQSTVGCLAAQRMVSLRTCKPSAQWEVLRYFSGVTQDISQLGG